MTRAASGQPDLFDARETLGAAPVRTPAARTPPPQAGAATLSDDRLVAALADAAPRDVVALCAEVASRSLRAAVPALEARWRRAAGFGVHAPLPEQLAVLKTLARLRGAQARDALRRIALSKHLPDSLLRPALRAAADARAALPAGFLSPLLEHPARDMRAAAFDLAALLSDRRPLRRGLADPEPAIRRAVAVALGARGDAAARPALLDALATDPATEIIEALAGVMNDDVIVHLGRHAARRSEHEALIIELLRESNDPKARRRARALQNAAEQAPG